MRGIALRGIALNGSAFRGIALRGSILLAMLFQIGNLLLQFWRHHKLGRLHRARPKHFFLLPRFPLGLEIKELFLDLLVALIDRHDTIFDQHL